MKKLSLFLTITCLIFPSISLASIDVNLKYGMKNPWVTELQEFLIEKGFLTGQATGNFFILTRKAVASYQSSVGILATGFVGPLTRNKINYDLSQTNTHLLTGNTSETGTTTPLIQNKVQDNPSLPTNPSVVSIDKFLLSPTIENLRLFCNSAKTLLGNEQEKVLNDTRTDFVMKNIALREQSQIKNLCDLALGERKYLSGESVPASLFQWVAYNPSYILEFNANDSDAVREMKINYNNYWKSLSPYKLIGFKTYSTSSDIATPNVFIEKHINQSIKIEGEASPEKVAQIITARLRNLERELSHSYQIPEKILSDLRTQLISK